MESVFDKALQVEDETTEEGRRIRSGGIGDDNWKHRSRKMRCEGCMAFILKDTSKPQNQNHLIGRCRRHAPGMGGFPVMFSDDWCCDHKLDEEKL